MEDDSEGQKDQGSEDQGSEEPGSEESEVIEEQKAEESAGSEERNDRDDREMHKAVCSDCGEECEVPFKPTEGKPVRCKECFRKNRPQRRGFDRGGRGGFDRRPREMHKAVCAECKKDCEVPFKPSGDKPVFCRECFANKR